MMRKGEYIRGDKKGYLRAFVYARLLRAAGSYSWVNPCVLIRRRHPYNDLQNQFSLTCYSIAYLAGNAFVCCTYTWFILSSTGNSESFHLSNSLSLHFPNFPKSVISYFSIIISATKKKLSFSHKGYSLFASVSVQIYNRIRSVIGIIYNNFININIGSATRSLLPYFQTANQNLIYGCRTSSLQERQHILLIGAETNSSEQTVSFVQTSFGMECRRIAPIMRNNY